MCSSLAWTLILMFTLVRIPHFATLDPCRWNPLNVASVESLMIWRDQYSKVIERAGSAVRVKPQAGVPLGVFWRLRGVLSFSRGNTPTLDIYPETLDPESLAPLRSGRRLPKTQCPLKEAWFRVWGLGQGPLV